MAQSQGKQWTHGKSWDYVNGLVAKSLLNLCEQYQYADWTGNYYQWAKEYADNAINPMVRLRILKRKYRQYKLRKSSFCFV